jgi:hypothetical protein
MRWVRFTMIKVFFKVFVMSFQIAAYSVIFVLQAAWFIIHKRSDKIGDAFGWYSKALVDSAVMAFRS